MWALKEQYIEDNKGKKLAIILPIDEYERMLEKLEELEDIRLYDEVKAKNEVTDSFEEYLTKRKK
jgi:PHD/YefM family antitoxin component YafN of YafNO toxin-antitoxin module